MTVIASYPTDMNDEQLMVVRPIWERVGKPGRPLRYDLRSIFNGCLYIIREGWGWRSLAKDAYPPWTLVYRHFQR
ncbi:MAG: transposase [Glaciimonas sp.]|nr:transposase [Glaciimonas sp.]